jgi:hypothetical protein
VGEAAGASFNFVLVNVYPNGEAQLGWHADGEVDLVPGATIASLSLGASRDFQMRMGNEGPAEHTWPLGHGDLLLMEGHDPALPPAPGAAPARCPGAPGQPHLPAGADVRVIIAGTRDLPNERGQVALAVATAVAFSGFKVTEVVSGCSGVVDLAGEAWARARGIPVKPFPYPSNADLVERGLSPKIPRVARGPIRNGWMADYAVETSLSGGALVLVWDGQSSGSFDMRKKARARGLQVYEVEVRR